MSCDKTITTPVVEATLDVTAKYNQLMQDSLGDDSLYMRSKDTLLRTFDDLQITEKEKAELVLSFVTQFSIQLSNVAMQSSLAWAKEERDGAYALGLVRSQARLAEAQTLKAIEEICKTEKETELVCAQITATIAGSIRDNGGVSTYDSDGCRPLTLLDEGTKYEQQQQMQADTYSRYADAYRKSGVVEIAVDTDGVKKAFEGINGPGGYTHQQEINAERLRLSYEDTKRNHVANSSANMIASMLTAEIDVNPDDVQRWRDAIDYLNDSDNSTLPTPLTP